MSRTEKIHNRKIVIVNMPFGDKRKVQLTGCGSAYYNFKNKKSITGNIINDTFVPHRKDDNLLLIMYKPIRERYNLPNTRKKYLMKRKEELNQRKFKVIYLGKIRFYYPYCARDGGYIKYQGNKVVGYNRNGEFIPN